VASHRDPNHRHPPSFQPESRRPPVPSGGRPPSRPAADRALNSELVASLLEDQFPALEAQAVHKVGSGRDNDVYLVDDFWVFRFPRRADRVCWLEREIEIMSVISKKLGRLVPGFRWFGQPSDAFPYPFVGYRWIPGIGADQIPDADLTPLAHDLGKALSQIHEIKVNCIPATPAGWENKPWSTRAAQLAAVAHLVQPLLSDALSEQVEPYLNGSVPAPSQSGPRRFIHNDICDDHILVDPGSHGLAGLIDFADAMVGDPVLDFVGLIGLGDRDWIAEAVRHYDHHDFQIKFDWLARTLTLHWLADATIDNPSQIPKHLTWVKRAFQPEQIRGTGSALAP
jgi:aminoglycoside phosphotransferase (APT) family kinase protein